MKPVNINSGWYETVAATRGMGVEVSELSITPRRLLAAIAAAKDQAASS